MNFVIEDNYRERTFDEINEGDLFMLSEEYEQVVNPSLYMKMKKIQCISGQFYNAFDLTDGKLNQIGDDFGLIKLKQTDRLKVRFESEKERTNE